MMDSINLKFFIARSRGGWITWNDAVPRKELGLKFFGSGTASGCVLIGRKEVHIGCSMSPVHDSVDGKGRAVGIGSRDGSVSRSHFTSDGEDGVKIIHSLQAFGSLVVLIDMHVQMDSASRPIDDTRGSKVLSSFQIGMIQLEMRRRYPDRGFDCDSKDTSIPSICMALHVHRRSCDHGTIIRIGFDKGIRDTIDTVELEWTPTSGSTSIVHRWIQRAPDNTTTPSIGMALFIVTSRFDSKCKIRVGHDVGFRFRLDTLERQRATKSRSNNGRGFDRTVHRTFAQ